MTYPPIAWILATTLVLPLVPSSALAAPEKAEKHMLSEWRIGSVLFGEKLSKSDMKGKVVVIENWGVNCPPCIASLPHLAELDKRNRDKGLLIIGAESQNSSKDAIEPLLKKAKVDYTITAGADGPINVTGIPRIFVFDRTGALVFDGSPSADEFERAVKKALREGAAAAESPPAPPPSGPLIATRAWTNAQGQQIKAAVKSADDTKAVFQMANGKLVDYELTKLSDESREVIAAAVTKAKGGAESGDAEEE